MRRLWCLASVLALSGVAAASPSDKPEKASAAVKRLAKAFGKLKSYRVAVTIEGGQAQGDDGKSSRLVGSKRDALGGKLRPRVRIRERKIVARHKLAGNAQLRCLAVR